MDEKKTSNINQAGVETNAVYMMTQTMDLMLRDMEFRMLKERERFSREKKQQFNRYLHAVKTACILNEQLTQDIYDCDEKHNFKNVQIWQEQANELARLILLYADKSVDQDVVDRIFKFIREQPGEGIVDEKMLESFYLKKI